MPTEAAGGPGESLQVFLRTLWPQTAESSRPGVAGQRTSTLSVLKHNSNTKFLRLLVAEDKTANHNKSKIKATLQ